MSPRARCLEVLRRELTVTVRTLAARTGLSRPTVEGLLDQLAHDGLIDSELAPAPPRESGGRPARRYRFRAERSHIVGLDLSDTHLRMAIADLAGAVVHSDIKGPSSPRTGASGLEPVRDWVSDNFLAAGLPLDSLAGVSVAVPGIVTADGRLATAPSVREWEQVNIAARFGEVFACPVTVENDLVLAAIAEARMGAARLADTSLYVLTWFHVAARLVTGGRVHLGRNRQAGEMASLRVLASGARGRERPWESLDQVDNVLAGLDIGEPDALATLTELVDQMAPAVGGLLAAVDPEVVILGGRLGRYSDHVAPMLRRRLTDQLSLAYEYPIVGSDLGELAPAMGALLRAFAEVGPSLVNTPGVSVPRITLRPEKVGIIECTSR